jgi:hypothetical protein
MSRLQCSRLALILALCHPAPAAARDQQPAARVPEREWASPAELRSKKLVDAGIYTLDSKLDARWLAEHPEFTTTHPFDGLAVRLPLDDQWCKSQAVPPNTYLDDLAWSSRPVAYDAVKGAIADLRRTKWGALTDNFLWWNLRGGVEQLRADLESDEDWKALEHNARLAARVCRAGKLKGLLFDTEQYGVFPNTKLPYPFGKAKPELLRKRGRAWMEAVQKECPDVIILFTFAWSPDLDSAGFLAGVKAFLNGMLDGIKGKARIVHGYENTFYYGQAAGSRFTRDGFRGDRGRYEEAVASMRKWSSLSGEPRKFERHVRVGMAAWLESDPWNLWSGWPGGTRDTIWSNLPLALATSEEYVWCWSEHTNYLHTFTDPVPGLTGLNPFLASLANQTFNTRNEAVAKLNEEFVADPLARGWYFDFDMLGVGRKRNPGDSGLSMPREAVPYRWLPEKRLLHVSNAWTSGPGGRAVVRHDRQRRRFVHPIRATRATDTLRAEFDFSVASFGEDRTNPILLGLFRSDRPANRSSLTLRISGADTASIVLAGEQGEWESGRFGSLKADRSYRFLITWNGDSGRLEARLIDLGTPMPVGELGGVPPTSIGGLVWDEVGIAQPDWVATETPVARAHTYHVTRVRFERK